LFPIFQGRKTLAGTLKMIFLGLTGQKHPKAAHGPVESVVMAGGPSPNHTNPQEKAVLWVKSL
jgi:hypothetical protein